MLTYGAPGFSPSGTSYPRPSDVPSEQLCAALFLHSHQNRALKDCSVEKQLPLCVLSSDLLIQKAFKNSGFSMAEVLLLFIFISLFPISLASYIVMNEVPMGRRRCGAEVGCKPLLGSHLLGLLTSSGEEGSS